MVTKHKAGCGRAAKKKPVRIVGLFKSDKFADIEYDNNGIAINPPKGYRQAVPGTMGLVPLDRRRYKVDGKYWENKSADPNKFVYQVKVRMKNQEQGRSIRKNIGRFGNGEDKPIHANLAEEKKSRARLNKELGVICKHRHKNNIPWGLITEAVLSAGFVMPLIRFIDDNKPGRINVQIGNKTWLAVQWYPFQNDTFEITAYAS